MTHAVGDVPPDGLGDGFMSGGDAEAMSPRARSPSLDNREEGPSERTQCHEPSSSDSPYTMRPSYERHEFQVDDDDDDLDEDPEIDPGQEDQMDLLPPERPETPKPHHPQLQIRRDLHPPRPSSKPSTITSASMEHSFLGPFRKRALGADHPLPSTSGKHTPPMNLRMHPPPPQLAPQFLPQSILMPPSTSLKPPDLPPPPGHISSRPGPSKIQQLEQPGPSGMASDLSMKKDELPPPRPPQNPPKKTGFTIEDIMRR